MGKDPSQTRQLSRLAATVAGNSTFGAVAKSRLEKNRVGWSDIHYQKSLRAFERDVLPVIGRLALREITAPMIVAVIRTIASRGARETAGRILQRIGGVLRFGEALGLYDRDPSPAAAEVLPKQKIASRRDDPTARVREQR